MTLDEARENVGRRVVYRSKGGDTVEPGWISSVGWRFVFVRYDGRRQAAATDPADLEFES